MRHGYVFVQAGGQYMAGQTITRAHLSEAVYQEVGLSRNESADLVETVLREISDTLTEGEAVKISSFGSFSVRQKGQRTGRNPKTGEEVPILPRRVLVFRASNVLKNRINDGMAEAEAQGAEAAPAYGVAPAVSGTAPATPEPFGSTVPPEGDRE